MCTVKSHLHLPHWRLTHFPLFLRLLMAVVTGGNTSNINCIVE